MRRCCLLVLVTSWVALGWGQNLPIPHSSRPSPQRAIIVEGDQAPRQPLENTWWYNPKEDGLILIYQNGAWADLDLWATQCPQAWHGMVVMIEEGEKTVATVSGVVLLEWAQNLFWRDSIWGSYDVSSGRMVLNRQGDTLVKYENRPEVPPEYDAEHGYIKPIRLPIAWDTLAGQEGASLPAYHPVTSDLSYGHICQWGFLGTNGRWLIPAIYDEPFRFHNGVAEVLQYGQKRKINEKGELVE